MRVHEYLADPSSVDRPQGEPRCLCGMPKKNRRHKTAEDHNEEEKARDARVLGESDAG